MPTIKDVAKACGLSPMSVSFALNDKPGTVSKDTRERVRRVAAEMGYRPNAIARSLQRGRTDTIALYTGGGFMDPRVAVFAEVLAGLQSGCSRRGKDLLMHGKLDQVSDDDAYEVITNGKADGMILHTLAEDRLVQLLREASFPLVTVIDRLPGLPCVVVDVAEGGRLLAEHLAAAGHRKVLYRTPSNPPENLRSRAEAFHAAALSAGIDATMGTTPDWTGAVGPEERELLTQRGRTRHTAVVGCTDIFAYPVCDVCDALGMRIPDDIAVAGFNGVAPLMTPRFRLTTIHAPWSDIGDAAIDLLMLVIDGGKAPLETVVSVKLVTGETT